MSHFDNYVNKFEHEFAMPALDENSKIVWRVYQFTNDDCITGCTTVHTHGHPRSSYDAPSFNATSTASFDTLEEAMHDYKIKDMCRSRFAVILCCYKSTTNKLTEYTKRKEVKKGDDCFDKNEHCLITPNVEKKFG